VSEAYRKPAPHFVREIAHELRAPLERTWVVGDTMADLEAASRAGAKSIAVTWGFRTRESLEAGGAQRLADTPEELLAALGV
jgi:phosphoglycolate phosphatase